MKSLNIKQALLILFVAYSTINFSAVNAALYTYSIGGFTGSARLNDGTQVATYTDGWISGTFEGEDTMDIFGNPGANGIISGSLRNVFNPGNEMSHLSITFGGNSFFDGVGSTNPDNFGISYDIRNNTFSLNFLADTGISRSYVEEVTGDAYTDHPSATLTVHISSGGTVPSALFRVFVFFSGDVFDPITGDRVDGNKIFSGVRMTSNEQVVVSQVPLPGALLFFATGLSGLGMFRRFSRKNQ